MQISLFLFGNIKILQKKVFIIIVTYNGEKWIQKNLQSLQRSLFPVEILVIDNHSSDNTVALVEAFKEVQLILLNENIGFGKANNMAIKKALELGADYLFLLNQDTWMYPETLKNLVLVAESNPEFGILSPLHYASDALQLDANFKTYWNRKTNSISNNIDEVPFVNAAAWLLPKVVIEKVGYFEPLFNHYGEDRNYADRTLYHSFKIVVVKDAKICHDRIIARHFDKDVKQSKFRMLSEVLNINNYLIISYLKAFLLVFGLPKYFYKFYSFRKSMHLFFELLRYYIVLKTTALKIIKTRLSYK